MHPHFWRETKVIRFFTKRSMTAKHSLAFLTLCTCILGSLSISAFATNLLTRGYEQREWAQTGNYEALRSYLIKGGDVAVEDRDGITLLMLATQFETLDIVDLLVEFNANMEKGDKGGNTALHWATLHQSIESLEHLLSIGADPNSQNRNGETPLAIAVREDDRLAVQILLDAGADPAISDYTGRSIMDLARQSRDREIENILFRAGAR